MRFLTLSLMIFLTSFRANLCTESLPNVNTTQLQTFTAKSIDPLTVINPLSGKNLFIQTAYYGDAKFLNALIKDHPNAFLNIGSDIIEELLTRGHDASIALNAALEFEKLGGELDLYHRLWLQIACKDNLKEQQAKTFSTLSPGQQQTLYNAAFLYNNASIHEPPDHLISPEQYSINLMWINEEKMLSDQQLLFGNGATLEERYLDFQMRFIKPVSAWAKANPESIVNIWLDSLMANHSAIEYAKSNIKTFLAGTSHAKIQFRDVRSISKVHKNPSVFSENIPIYFRVDLLRAIAAEHILTEKEAQFFVYGDIDMEPLSKEQLFDKKTMDFLEDYGFVMAKGGHLGFENGFQILNGNHPQFMDSHSKVLIDLNIEMATEKPTSIVEQQIYDSYPAMLTHFLDNDGRYGKLNLSIESLEKLKLFRFDKFKTSAHKILPLGCSKARLKEVIPRKPVKLPPSHF
jgi:hypothetical protein